MPHSMLRELWHSSGTHLFLPVVKGRGMRREGRGEEGEKGERGGRRREGSEGREEEEKDR